MLGKLIGGIIGIVFSLLRSRNRTKSLEQQVKELADFKLHSICGEFAFDVENKQLACRIKERLVILKTSDVKSIETFQQYHQLSGTYLHGLRINTYDFENPFYTMLYGSGKVGLDLRDATFSKMSILFNLT